MRTCLCVIAAVMCTGQALADQVSACLTANAFESPSATADDCAGAATQTHEPVLRAQVLQKLGVAQRELGQLAESRLNLTEAVAVALSRGDARARHQLGWTHRMLGDYAELQLRAALDLQDDWQSRLALCVVLQDQGRFADSVDPCQTALTQGGANRDTSYFMARAYNHTEVWPEALTAAMEGLALPDPGARLYEQAA